MRPQEDMEKFVRIRKPRATTSSEMDKRTLHDSFAAMDQITQADQTKYKPSARRVIVRNRIMRLIAAAAVIVVLISLFIVRRGPDEQVDTVVVANSTKSPAGLLTVASLSMAYRRGGIEALEKQFEKALEMLGPRSINISDKQLLAEFNGT
jgi:hypothetical protein